MRAAVLLGVLAVVAAPARADVETADPSPMPARSIAAGIAGHGGRYLGRPIGGWGPYVEVAFGHRRFPTGARRGARAFRMPDGGSSVLFGIGMLWGD